MLINVNDRARGWVDNTKISRRELLMASTAIALLPSITTAAPNSSNLIDHGGVGDGVTDNSEAFRRALTAIGPSGTLYVPPGNFRLYDDPFSNGAEPLRLIDGQELVGEAGRSVVSLSRRRMSAFYGLAIAGNNVRIRGLEFRCSSTHPGWTAALAITRSCYGTSIHDTAFVGEGGRSGHYGVLPIGADLEEFSMERCQFRGLDFGFLRQTSDTSTYRYLNFVDCTADDCTEVIEINAPGLLLIETTAGAVEVERFADSDNRPLATTTLKVGQTIRCDAFPSGTTITSIGRSGKVTLSNPAILSSPLGQQFRLSAGGASHGRISNLVARRIGQWAVGMSNCDDWDIDVVGENIGYELVHIEDASRNIRINVAGSNTNLQRGVVGSPEAENGMVQISSGSRDIYVRFNALDLRDTRSPNPVALCVFAGGIMGTTGRRVAPKGIRVAGKVVCGDRSRAVVAFESELAFDDFEVVASPTEISAAAKMRLAGCSVSGRVRTNLTTPQLIMQESNNPRGRIQFLPASTEDDQRLS